MATNEVTIELDPIPAETLAVPIIGTSPLIMHRFSEKAKRQMLDNMQGRKKVKEARDPQADYEEALYRLKGGDGYGMPAGAFKQATVGGARFYQGLTMTSLRQLMFFRGEPAEDGLALVRINGEPQIREDVVRVQRTTDLRYRPMFPEWTAVLEVTYVPSSLTKSSLLSLIDAGGMGIGIGEWRPEKNGEFGTYRIDSTKEIEVVK